MQQYVCITNIKGSLYSTTCLDPLLKLPSSPLLHHFSHNLLSSYIIPSSSSPQPQSPIICYTNRYNLLSSTPQPQSPIICYPNVITDPSSLQPSPHLLTHFHHLLSSITSSTISHNLLSKLSLQLYSPTSQPTSPIMQYNNYYNF